MLSAGKATARALVGFILFVCGGAQHIHIHETSSPQELLTFFILEPDSQGPGYLNMTNVTFTNSKEIDGHESGSIQMAIIRLPEHCEDSPTQCDDVDDLGIGYYRDPERGGREWCCTEKGAAFGHCDYNDPDVKDRLIFNNKTKWKPSRAEIRIPAKGNFSIAGPIITHNVKGHFVVVLAYCKGRATNVNGEAIWKHGQEESSLVGDIAFN